MHAFEALTVDVGSVGIHWFGQNSFALKDAAGTIVLIDPYFPSNRPPDRFVHETAPLDEADLATDFVLLTHDHMDHTCPETLLRIHNAFPSCRFVGPPGSVDRLRDRGIRPTLLTEVTAGDEVDLGTMKVCAFWSKPPEGDPAAGIDPPDTQHLGYVIEAGGVRVYDGGDTIHTFAEHDELIEPIARLQPDIGLLTTHPTEGEFPFFDGSVKTAVKLGLTAAVPAHYDCFALRTYDPNEWAALFPPDGPTPMIIPYDTSIVFPPAEPEEGTAVE
jgi:L-ascorbate metabolism protein UlaG (beta-lactamase superfamily)